ncbi:serine-type D-Ala-D-Ala carboxypeptidase, partial [Klebsiella pneumoniae subsp. pneumoniae]|nr:serine-type D-Ala-D-Ala carboxypeptidase [Klebsiella pneumoniae subsp. pneumoniae]
APSDRVRFAESEKILSWGFRFFETVAPVKADTPLTTERVWFGDISEVPLGAEKDIYVTIPKGKLKDLKATFELDSTTLEAPLAKNQVVGKINFILDDKVVEQRPLVVQQQVEDAGFFGRIWDY